VELTEQFRTNRTALLENKREIKDRIKASSEVIRKTAQDTLKEVKDLVGLLNVKQ
jgi:tryptophanyl-tRNA synthetase